MAALPCASCMTFLAAPAAADCAALPFVILLFQNSSRMVGIEYLTFSIAFSASFLVSEKSTMVCAITSAIRLSRSLMLPFRVISALLSLPSVTSIFAL